MGITSFDIKVLDGIIEKYKPSNVIEAGAQNLYNQPVLPAPYADTYYKEKGLQYDCIDLSKENNCLVLDLSKPFTVNKKYSLATNFGTFEHCGDNGKFSWEAIYNCFLNFHKLLELNGIIVHENPLTEHWHQHGFFYFTKEFYIKLSEISDYEIIVVDIVCAMGNCDTGKNVICVMKKNGELFPTLELFKTLDLRQS